MSTCCCSLPYMNANACRNCPNNSSRFIDYNYSPYYKLNDYDTLIIEIRELRKILQDIPNDRIFEKLIHENKLKHAMDKLTELSDFPTFIEKLEKLMKSEE